MFQTIDKNIQIFELQNLHFNIFISIIYFSCILIGCKNETHGRASTNGGRWRGYSQPTDESNQQLGGEHGTTTLWAVQVTLLYVLPAERGVAKSKGEQLLYSQILTPFPPFLFFQ